MIEEYTYDEVKKLLRGSKKRVNGAGIAQNAPNATEVMARDYLCYSQERTNSPPRWGVPAAFYEAMTFQLGGITYTPDWVLMWGQGAYRELIEVKGVGPGWKGHRIREARAKLEFLAHIVQPFGWRVFLVNVGKNKITEQEIGVHVHSAHSQGDG